MLRPAGDSPTGPTLLPSTTSGPTSDGPHHTNLCLDDLARILAVVGLRRGKGILPEKHRIQDDTHRPEIRQLHAEGGKGGCAREHSRDAIKRCLWHRPSQAMVEGIHWEQGKGKQENGRPAAPVPPTLALYLLPP